MAQFEKKLEQVEAFRTKGGRRLNTASGIRLAKEGQWVVLVGDGVYELVDDVDFRAKYTPLDEAAEEALEAQTASELAAEEEAEADGEDKPKKKGLLAKAKDALTGGGGKDAEENEYAEGFLNECKELVVEAEKLPQSDELVKGLAELKTALELGASQEFIAGKCEPVNAIVEKVKADGNQDK